MQTFLSENTFERSAAVLDDKRLNKQLLEGRQILKLLVEQNKKAAWFNHPAVRMWDGYVPFLYQYLIRIKNECKARGIKYDTNWNVIKQLWSQYKQDNDKTILIPFWWSDKKIQQRLLQSHKVRLYEKEFEKTNHYEFYSIYALTKAKNICCEKCNYFWPSHYERNL